MSRSNFSVNNPYPVAGNSRSRRRLVVRMNQQSGDPQLASAPGRSEAALPDETSDRVTDRPVTEMNGLQFDIPTFDASPVEGVADTIGKAKANETPGRQSFVAQTLPCFAGLKELFDFDIPASWLFVGDGIAHSSRHGSDYRIYSEQLAHRVRWELGRHDDAFMTNAAPDETVSSLLYHYEKRIARFQPTVVSIMVGLNDASSGPEELENFQGNLHQLVEAIREMHARPLLHTPHCVRLPARQAEENLLSYVRAIRQISREYEVPCVDHWDHWKQQAPDFNHQGHDRWLADDGLHPSSRGQRELARLTMMRLGIFDNRSSTCSLPENGLSAPVAGTNR